MITNRKYLYKVINVYSSLTTGRKVVGNMEKRRDTSDGLGWKKMREMWPFFVG